MEIIEKQIEKIKEVPYGYWDGCPTYYGCNKGWNTMANTHYASKGVAGTGLGLR